MTLASVSFMQQAIAQARLAASLSEVPVGAVIVDAKGSVIAAAHNLTESLSDPSSHAELVAIRAACAALKNPRLTDCDLYVTLEPCPMCAQAISFARIRRLYFGAYDVKGGGVEHGARIFHQSSCHHAPEVVGGMQESECSLLLKDFFKDRRS